MTTVKTGTTGIMEKQNVLNVKEFKTKKILELKRIKTGFKEIKTKRASVLSSQVQREKYNNFILIIYFCYIHFPSTCLLLYSWVDYYMIGLWEQTHPTSCVV